MRSFKPSRRRNPGFVAGGSGVHAASQIFNMESCQYSRNNLYVFFVFSLGFLFFAGLSKVRPFYEGMIY